MGKYSFDLKLTIKYIAQAIIIGIIGGLLGCAYNFCLSYCTKAWQSESTLLFSILMPVIGLLIVFVDKRFGTNAYSGSPSVVAEASGKDTTMSPSCAPVSFVTLLLTNLAETVTGREGASWQLAAPIAKYIHGKWFTDTQKKIAISCAIASGFGCIWGLPIFGACIASEIAFASFYFPAFGPSMLSGLIAKLIGTYVYPVKTNYVAEAIGTFSALDALRLVIFAVAVGLLARLLLSVLNSTQIILSKIKNLYLRIFVGGAIIAVLCYFTGKDYLCGVNSLMLNAFSGQTVPWYSFAAKMVFFAILLKSGYKTGTLIQTFGIGAMFGSVFASVLGLPLGFGAQLGVVTLFTGVFNCPIAALMLVYEAFGKNCIWYCIPCILIAKFVSGKECIYKGQVYDNPFKFVSFRKN